VSQCLTCQPCTRGRRADGRDVVNKHIIMPYLESAAEKEENNRDAAHFSLLHGQTGVPLFLNKRLSSH
jgi:hypothetical protein